MKEKRIIGIDIGGTNFRIGVVGESGKAELFRKVPVSEVFRTEALLDDLLSYLSAYMAELKADVSAVSIGFPASERVFARARKPFPAENLEILYTADENEKGVVGAAYYAAKQSGHTLYC